MIRFLNSIDIKNIESFDIDFDAVARNIFDRNQVDMSIVKNTPWTYDLLREFQDGLNELHYPYKLTFSYRNKPSIYDAISLFEGWYFYIYHMVNSLTIYPDSATIFFVVSSEEEKEKNIQMVADFKDFLKFLNYDFSVDFVIKPVEKVIKLSANKMAKIEEKAIKAVEESQNEKVEEITDYRDDLSESQAPVTIQDAYEDSLIRDMKANYQRMVDERKRKRVYKKGDYRPVEHLCDIPEFKKTDDNVDITGTIFMVDLRPTRMGVSLRIGLEDDTSGVYVRVFSSDKKGSDKAGVDDKSLKQLKKGMNVRILGCPQEDKFTHKIGVFAHSILLLPKTALRSDDEVEKRVELHLHTKMSTMDGLSSIEEYCDLAKNMGHRAIAITDHGVVHAHPNAQKAAKKCNLKVLYGCEMYMVDNVLNCAINPSDIELSNATYVVLDFETTGLSFRYDQILEFGATRFEKGMIRNQIDLFVKPTIKISDKITNLTGITDDMVKDGHPIKEALKIIEEFTKDAILVTHNAEFDIGFLNEARRNNGLAPITNPVIDTLSLSRYLFPEAKFHRLGTLARNLDITTYNEEEAHRADFDAKVLLDVWLAILTILTKNNRHLTHRDLTKLQASNHLLKHLKAKHIIVFAKNQDGLRDLYRLVSLSHTDYLADVPKIPRSELIASRKNLLFGSACFNGEIFEIARTKTYDELLKAIEFYDYIEVQPLENYSYLVNMGEMTNGDVLRTIKDIIAASDAAHKLVCATGDVHYANPNQKLYRDVYIFAKGLGGVNHPLNPFSRKKHAMFDNPNQHYRSTREMLDCFSFLSEDKAKEIVVTNPNKIVDWVSDIKPVKDRLYPPFIKDSDKQLTDIVYKTAHKMYGEVLPPIIENRLKRELDGIISNGYSVTYTIAHLIVKKANEDGYFVGSRGSVGSSLVATMAGITEVNPLPPHYLCPKCHHFELSNDSNCHSGFDLPAKHCPNCGELMIGDGQNIPFETFLGFEAEKVPDIDLNLPSDYQSKAHDYTKVLLGEDNVFRAGTIGTIAEKTAFGYVKGYYEYLNVDPSTIDEANIARIASHCEGVKKTTGQHPGGIVVIPADMNVFDFTPVQYPADEASSTWKTTHFEFDALHDTLLKLDLLGHDDPVVLKMLLNLTGLKLDDIPLSDSKVLSLFNTDKALNKKSNYLKIDNGVLGLPEFGTRFVRSIVDDTHPKTFADLLIISGLSHGTEVWQNNAEMLIKEKKYTLKDVIGCRDDIMTFLISKGVPSNIAFQIMEDVRHGKALKPEYVDVMLANNVGQYYIDSCNRIKYLFPKAHATAYVMMADRVAYFKVYYPLEFYASFFSIHSKAYDINAFVGGQNSIIHEIEAIKNRALEGTTESKKKDEDLIETLQLALEMCERGYSFSNISLEKSEATRFVVDHETNSLIPPFATIDGLGEAAANSVVEARKNGPFISQEDLLARTKLNSSNLKILNQLGVLKGLGETNQMSLFDFSF